MKMVPWEAVGKKLLKMTGLFSAKKKRDLIKRDEVFNKWQTTEKLALR